jgi:putative transposase
MSTKPSTGRVRSAYEFIKAHRDRYSVQTMCRVLGVAPSGYYEWLQQPISNRGREDARLLRLIRASFVASHGIYGAPRVFIDLREAGETCSKHRVARLMREANLRALHGYRTRRWAVGKPSVLIPNLSSDNSPPRGQTPPGSPTSPISGPGRAGSTWPWSWICSRA